MLGKGAIGRLGITSITKVKKDISLAVDCVFFLAERLFLLFFILH